MKTRTKKEDGKRMNAGERKRIILFACVLVAVLAILVIIYFVSGGYEKKKIENQLNNVEIPAEYDAAYSSYGKVEGGGTSFTNITYHVKEGNITLCRGSQIFAQGMAFESLCILENAKDFGALLMEELISKIKNLDIKDAKLKSVSGFKGIGELACIYNMREIGKSVKKVACFDKKNQLVDYGGLDVFKRNTEIWHLKGYGFTKDMVDLLK